MAAMGKDARTRLLDAALTVIRSKGYADTSVDELCQAAGVTKGAFFHHFRSKEALGVAAAAHFGEMAAGLFAAAPYQALTAPLERLLGYVDFRREILSGEIPDYTCLLGTMVQEAYATHPAIREACAREITGHAPTLEADIAALMAQRGGADLTRRRPRPAHPGRAARRLHHGQGDRRCAGRRRQPWPSPPLPHIALRTKREAYS